MENISLSITVLYAALLGLMLIAVSIRVVRLRVKHKVNLFDGGVEELGQAIRVQGNFIEYVPLAIILMAAVELGGAPAWAMHGFGGGLFVGRLLWRIAARPGTVPDQWPLVRPHRRRHHHLGADRRGGALRPVALRRRVGSRGQVSANPHSTVSPARKGFTGMLPSTWTAPGTVHGRRTSVNFSSFTGSA